MCWRIAIIGVLLGLLLLVVPFTPVKAADPNVEIEVYAWVVGFPNGLTITYVSDYELQLDWVKGEDAVNTMVRVKDGSAPTSRTDGNLLYYGDGTTATDTGLDFQEATLSKHYALWSENAGGAWSPWAVTDFMENPNLTFIGLIIAAGIVSFLAFKSRLPAMKFFGGLPWILLALYIRGNPPGNLTEGDAVHTAMWLIFVGIGLLIMVVGLSVRTVDRTESGKDYTEKSEGFRFGTPDFLKNKNSSENIRKRREEDNESYREKVRNAARPRKYRR